MKFKKKNYPVSEKRTKLSYITNYISFLLKLNFNKEIDINFRNIKILFKIPTCVIPVNRIYICDHSFSPDIKLIQYN